MRSLYSVALASVALALSGCLSDAKDPDRPPPGTGDGVPNIPVVGATFKAQFDPLSAIVPYPNDILGFVAQPGTDGTLNLPAQALQPLAPLVNQLDGFSTNGRIQANFTRRVAPASLTPASVFLLEVAISPQTKAVVGLADSTLCKLGAAPPSLCTSLGVATTGNPFLVQGVDYSVGVAPDLDAGGQTIQLKPLRPLNANRANVATPGTENGYLMILTNGITDTSGAPAQADTVFAQVRGGYISGAIQLPPPGTPLPPNLTTEQLLGLFLAAHLAVGENLGIAPGSVVATASFTTQDTRTVLETAAAMAEAGDAEIVRMVTPVPLPGPGGSTIPAGFPVTTALVLGLQAVDATAIPGEGDVYVGSLEIPYYLAPPSQAQPTAPLSQPWIAATESPLDNASRVLNKYNPVPHKRADVKVPIVITLPNANTAHGATPPANGWPVVIFYHGITRNRLDMFAITEPLNDRGYAVVAIDQPLHGIAAGEIDFETITPEQLGAILQSNPFALFRVPGVMERTFDLDLVNNTTGATGPDGQIDASGTHFINLSNGLVSRDNLRQAAIDLVALTRSLGTMDVTGNGSPDLDGSRVHFIGVSLGAIAGTTYLSLDDTASTATLGVAGGTVSDLLLDSFSFGPRIEAGLIGNGLVPNTSLYNNFIRDLQTLVDAGDPISHARAAAGSGTAIHFIQVHGDTVVPNSASNRLAAQMKPALVDYAFSAMPVVDLGGLLARVCFTDGATHGSQLDPGTTPASQTVTGEMQAQQAVFIAGNPAPALPANGTTLLFGGSGSPLAPTVYGNFTDDCNAPNRPRANTGN